MDAAKWSTRKVIHLSTQHASRIAPLAHGPFALAHTQDALQAVLDLASAPRLADGDYADLVRLVKRVSVACGAAHTQTIAKDSNVVNVALAARVIAALANGVRKPFSAQVWRGVCVCVSGVPVEWCGVACV